MKKTKLISRICVFMVVCMLASMVMTSCNSGESVEDLPQNRKAVTMTILYCVDDSTTPEALAEVEKELNYITEQRYTTRIKLVGLKKGEYEAEIARRFEVYDEEQEKLKEEASIQASLEKVSKEQARRDKAAGITQAPTKRPTEPPKTTELYTQRIEWPKTTDDQLDVFLITSAEMFAELAKAERLAGMDDELNTKAKVLKEYIHPSIMMAGQYGDKTVAIPTNKIIGTATYMAVNTDLVAEYNSYVEAFNESLKNNDDSDALGDEGKSDPKKAVDLKKLTEYQHLTEYLEWVKEYRPDVALIEGPFQPLKNFNLLFPEMPEFALVSGSGKTLVYVPEQEPTEPPTKAPTEPPTDDEGNLIPEETEDPASTTVPPTTNKPKNTPAVTTLSPDNISLTNKYTSSAFLNIVKLNMEYREKGLFESSAVPADKERAVYIAQGTLEDRLAWEAADKANGFNYEYILYGNPVADKADLQNGMYAISVSSKITVSRCMEIITLLNTNKKFKNTFQYGKEGVHYNYTDNGRIERLSSEYMVNTNYTGNTFIADLMEGDNPNKWEIAKDHNLNVVNSVFLQFYLDKKKLSPASEEAIPEIYKLSKEFNDILMSGNIPAEYEDLDEYIDEYVKPAFDDAGWTDLFPDIRTQTNPPQD